MFRSRFSINLMPVISLITLLLSCTQVFQTVPKDDQTGKLTISFVNRSKSLLPDGDLALASLDLVLTKTGSSTIECNDLSPSTTNIDPIIVQVGMWTVTVNGRNAAGELIASGKASAEIKPAETTAVSITVKPLAGNGILSLSATIAEGVARSPVITGQLIPVAGGETINLSMLVADDRSSATYEAITIPAGWYTLTLSVADGATVVANSEPEAVQIAEGRRTLGTVKFVFDPSLGRVVVSIALAMDDPITITLSGFQSTFTANKSMTVTAATSETVTSYRWFIDNIEQTSQTSDTLIVQGSLGIGNHRLGLVVNNASKVASKSVFFTILPIPTFSVTYNGNGQSSGAVPVDAKAYQEGQSVTVCDNTGNLVKNGLWFSGWNTSTDGSGTDYTPLTTFTMETANITLYAKWTVKPKYTVNFSSEGGTAVNSLFTDLINEVPESTKNGCALEGWFLDNSFADEKRVDFPYTPTSNITFYAKWIPATQGLCYTRNDSGYSVTKGIVNFTEEVLIPNFWLGLKVTIIGNNAFLNCTSLTSIIIPSSIKTIDAFAFAGCNNLTSINIPNSVTTIGSQAFNFCTALTSITIPDSITSIDVGAFSYCKKLETVSIPKNVTSIKRSTFEGCSRLSSFIIPDNISIIDDYAFRECRSLINIKIPNSVISLGKGIFYGCDQLSSVIISTNASVIDDNTFYGCSNLKSIVLPTSIDTIGLCAFQNCSGLTEMTIPNSVTSIKSEAFHYCSGLTSITLSNNLTSIGAMAFEGCSALTTLTIPNSVSEIGYRAFFNCTGLNSVTLPNNITFIPYGVLGYCSNLVNLIIPSSVTTIEGWAFAGCQKLRTLTIPSKVTAIGECIFEYCTITELFCNPVIPPYITRLSYNFNCQAIKVPSASVTDYKVADGWYKYASFIISQ